MAKRLLFVTGGAALPASVHRAFAPPAFGIDTVESAEQALAHVATHEVSAVLVQAAPPWGEGLEAASALASGAGGRRVPLVLFAEGAPPRVRNKARSTGAEWFESPGDGALFCSYVDMLLRLQEAADELAARDREIERARRLQRDLADVFAHDLKGPLAAIQFNLSWVGEQLGDASGPREAALCSVDEGLRRVKRVVDDLLALSRLDGAEGRATFRRTDLGQLARELGRSFVRDSVRKGVGVRVEASPGAWVLGDPLLLRQAFEALGDILLSQVAPGGRFALTARASGEQVSVLVGHSGPRPVGFDWSPLAQGDAPDTPPLDGCGRGLLLFRRVIEGLGGSVAEGPEGPWPVAVVARLPSAGRRAP